MQPQKINVSVIDREGTLKRTEPTEVAGLSRYVKFNSSFTFHNHQDFLQVSSDYDMPRVLKFLRCLPRSLPLLDQGLVAVEQSHAVRETINILSAITVSGSGFEPRP
jgi:hypothetical protein